MMQLEKPKHCNKDPEQARFKKKKKGKEILTYASTQMNLEDITQMNLEDITQMNLEDIITII